VNSAALSPDGSRVLTASDDGTERLWNAGTGAALAVLSGHTGRVVGATFNTDGSRIVTAAFDNTARIWDAATGAALATLSGHTGWVNSATFSADGAHVVTASFDNTARVWDAKRGWAMVPDMRIASSLRRSARTGRALSPRQPTGPRACGMPLPAPSLPCSWGTPTE
jgi:WD40 repeat protein